jgi:hypothetical protein
VAKFKLGKTHHSGNNKRGIGTFDIDTKAATCNQIGLHSELHPLQCRSQFQNKSKKVHYLLCMVELQSVTDMSGLEHILQSDLRSGSL